MISAPAVATFEEISASEIPADVISAIGHSDTAAVVSSLIGRPVECNRISVALDVDDVAYVAQVVGGRLPEGATTLPDGITIKFFKVYIIHACITADNHICSGITPCYSNCTNVC